MYRISVAIVEKRAATLWVPQPALAREPPRCGRTRRQALSNDKVNESGEAGYNEADKADDDSDLEKPQFQYCYFGVCDDFLRIGQFQRTPAAFGLTTLLACPGSGAKAAEVYSSA